MYETIAVPISAVTRALERAGLTASDIDLFEFNEAFAAQVVLCQKALKIDESKLNAQGGAIALGHPLGSSGSRILGTLIERLKRNNLELGIASLCIGVGQGAAMLIKRV